MNDRALSILVFIDTGRFLYSDFDADPDWWTLRLWVERN